MRHKIKDFFWLCWLIFQRFKAHNGANSAAALTYTSLFAVVPSMTLLLSVLSVIPAFQGVGDQIQEFIFKNFVPSSGAALQEYLNMFSAQTRNLTLAGIVGLAVTAYMMLVRAERAFNVIWRQSKPRQGASSFLLYWAVLSLGPLLLGAGFAISTYVVSHELFSGPNLSPVVALIFDLVPILCSIAAFTLIYATVPNCRVPLAHALVGGIFAALMFEAAKELFSLYVVLFPNYRLIYGAFAAVPLFLLWLYLCWLIVLLGAELTSALSLIIPSKQCKLPKLLALLGVLRVMLECQKNGLAMDVEDLEKAGWPLSEKDWMAISDFLESEKLACRSGSESWVLCRDLSSFSMDRLLQHCPWPLPEVELLPASLDESWYPAFREALQALGVARAGIFSDSLALWLQPPESKESANPSAEDQGVVTG